MIGTGTFGNAATVILASGFAGPTDLGILPESVVALLDLPERVSLVRASDSVSFHLATKTTDPVRSDTSLHRWIADSAPQVVTAPDVCLAGADPHSFQLLKRVAAHDKHPALTYMRLPIKFVPRARAASKVPELWLRTVVLHTEESAIPFIRQGTRVGA
jgi:hypothetical protein